METIDKHLNEKAKIFLNIATECQNTCNLSSNPNPTNEITCCLPLQHLIFLKA